MKSKGFTLIELLVVVAIISLLSSIVLASLREARERAAASKFRQEVYQFINALELYNIQYGSYPDSMTVTPLNLNTTIPPEDFQQLLPKLPLPPFSGGRFEYVVNAADDYRCGNYTNVSPYIILINHHLFSIFPDWDIVYSSEGSGGDWSDPDNLDIEMTMRCFSL